MIYIRIPEKHDAIGVLVLAKSGMPVSCLPKNSYGVKQGHLRILKRKKIPFKRVDAKDIRLPKPSLAGC